MKGGVGVAESSIAAEIQSGAARNIQLAAADPYTPNYQRECLIIMNNRVKRQASMLAKYETMESLFNINIYIYWYIY